MFYNQLELNYFFNICIIILNKLNWLKSEKLAFSVFKIGLEATSIRIII